MKGMKRNRRAGMESESNKKIEGLLCMSTPMSIRKLIILLFLITLFILCPISSFSAEAAAAATIDLPLQEGGNLVSIPLSPTSTTLPAPLKSIDGNYTSVFAYNSSRSGFEWESFVSDRPSFLNVLTSIDENQGFWINMSSNETLTVNGTSGLSITYAVKEGWNLISYPSLTSGNITELLVDVNDSIIVVWAYNASDTGNKWKFYDPANISGSTLKTMDPGFGYWVKSKNDDFWIFNGTHYKKQLPDLTVSSIITDPMIPEVSHSFSLVSVPVEFGIHNSGNAMANNVTVKLYDEFQGDKTLLANCTFYEILPHTIIDNTMNSLCPNGFDFAGGQHNLTVEIDPNNTIKEENESNNELNYVMNVIDALRVSIAQTPTTGEVPIKINFTGLVTGGIPPYSFLWLSDNGFPRDQNTSFVFSTTGPHIVELFVMDSRGESWSNYTNFTLQNNNLSQNASFNIAIRDIVAISNTSVRIDVNASNSILMDVDAVRVIVRVQNKDNVSFDEVVYDNVISISPTYDPVTWCGSTWCTWKKFSVVGDNLLPGDYKAIAEINPYPWPVPESDYGDNIDLQDFTVTGLGYLPPISIENISIFPSESVNHPVEIVVNVTNNGPYDRFIKGTFYYINYTGGRKSIAIRTDFVKVGESVIWRKSWSAPRQENTTISVDVVDVQRDNTILANASKFLDVIPYDFSVSNLDINPKFPNATTAVPLEVTAYVHNLGNASGDIKYRIRVNYTVVVFEGSLYNIPPNGSRKITYAFQPWTPQVRVDVDLFTFHEDKPYKHMFDSMWQNNHVGGLIYVLAGQNCGLKDIVIGSYIHPFNHPQIYHESRLYLPHRYGEENNISLTLENLEGHAGNFAFKIEDDYLRWNDSEHITKSIVDTNFIMENYEPKKRKNLTYTWVPEQTGWHNLTITCGTNKYKKQVFVEPKIRVIDSGFSVPYYEPSYAYEWTNDNNITRLKLWTKSHMMLGGDISRISGYVYKDFIVEDGTDKDNVYTGPLIIGIGHVGLIDTFSAGYGSAAFRVRDYIGVDDFSYDELSPCSSGNVPCTSTLFAKPTDDEYWAGLAQEYLELGAGRKWYGEVVCTGIDYIACEHEFILDTNLWFDDMSLTNGKTYRIYQRLDATVSSGGLGVGYGLSYVDFYNHAPHNCDTNAKGERGLPIRGIWLNDFDFNVKSVEFNP